MNDRVESRFKNAVHNLVAQFFHNLHSKQQTLKVQEYDMNLVTRYTNKKRDVSGDFLNLDRFRFPSIQVE